MQTARKKREARPRPYPADGWLTPRHAAEVIGCSAATVANYALKGKLVKELKADRVFYELQSVLALKEELEKERAQRKAK